MGNFFHDKVELALKHIFYDMRSGNADGQRGLALLIEMNDKDDADAAYFLSRCYSGPHFVWGGHKFPVDDILAVRLAQKSISLGSAAGVIGGLRAEGVLTKEVRKGMPFVDLNQAWDILLEKATGGEAFCQYLIGNAYLWGDLERIENKPPKSFASHELYKAYVTKNLHTSISWFEKAFENGVYSAGTNMNSLYSEGRGVFFAPQPEKMPLTTKRGAEIGYPNFQNWHAGNLFEEKRYKEALPWYEKSAAAGIAASYSQIGAIYAGGKGGVEKNPIYALECYEKYIEATKGASGYNGAGAIYFEGSTGSPDYDKAVKYFELAHGKGNTWGNDMLAYCYLHGCGCKTNYTYAKQLLDEVKWKSDLKKYCLGVIYADGLGVPEDIGKGVELLQSSALPEAAEALHRFKKNIFGKWSRRK